MTFTAYNKAKLQTRCAQHKFFTACVKREFIANWQARWSFVLVDKLYLKAVLLNRFCVWVLDKARQSYLLGVRILNIDSGCWEIPSPEWR